MSAYDGIIHVELHQTISSPPCIAAFWGFASRIKYYDLPFNICWCKRDILSSDETKAKFKIIAVYWMCVHKKSMYLHTSTNILTLIGFLAP